MLALLNLVEYFVDELSLVANKEMVPGENLPVELDVDFDISRNSANPCEFYVSLMVNLNQSEKAFRGNCYKVSLKLSGFFRFDEVVNEENISAMISHNGLAMLYGIARATIAQATATSWHGKYLIPGVNFVELIKQKAEAASQAKSTKTSKKAKLK